MGPVEAIQTCFAKSFVWRGRASRAEFWWFNLLMAAVTIIIGALTDQDGTTAADEAGGTIYLLVMLACIFPGIAVTVRRLHDTNRSGAWYWIAVVPFVGGIILFVFLVTPGDPQPNQYGPNPYDRPVPPSSPHAGPAPDGYAATPVSMPGLHWCVTQGCPMYQTNVARDVCYSCGNPTQETEPR